MEAWESYQMYLGLKLHFTTDYDYTRYGGKTSVTKTSFPQKKKTDSFSLELQRNMMTKHWIIMLRTFVKSPKGWLGDFKEENYLEWSKNKQSLTYNFLTDMSFLFTVVDDFDSIFSCQNGQHSVIKELPRKEDFSRNDGNLTGITELYW